MVKYMFTASWCGNCQVMKPIIEQIPNIAIMDVDKYPLLVQKFNLMRIPAYVVDTEDGFRVETGIKDRETLENFYNEQEI
jgi:thioredoxin-like negative regulator of GroEL